jgi:hypothetical protein
MTDKNIARKRKTLRAFQAGHGVPINNQILLLNNPELNSRFFSILTDEPTKIRIPIGELRNALHRFRLMLYRLKFRFIRPAANRPIRISDAEGHIKKMAVLRLVIRALSKRIEHQVIFLGKMDLELNDNLMALFEDSDVQIYGNNMNTNDSRAHYFPMGRDFRGRSEHGITPCTTKSCLVYCNFSLDTHPIRPEVKRRLADKDFVLFRHMGKFRNYQQTHGEFYRELAASKFAIAPRGNAIETFRMWDSLYLGTIPIVVTEGIFHQELQDLPILFLKSYAELEALNAPELERIYKEMLDKEWNYSKLYLKYWMGHVLDSCQNYAH